MIFEGRHADWGLSVPDNLSVALPLAWWHWQEEKLVASHACLEVWENVHRCFRRVSGWYFPDPVRRAEGVAALKPIMEVLRAWRDNEATTLLFNGRSYPLPLRHSGPDQPAPLEPGPIRVRL